MQFRFIQKLKTYFVTLSQNYVMFQLYCPAIYFPLLPSVLALFRLEGTFPNGLQTSLPVLLVFLGPANLESAFLLRWLTLIYAAVGL